MVHRRELDGKEIVFGNQGALWGNAMTWWDHDTGSIWSQPLGEAIAGPRRGEILELLSSTLLPWGEWRELHPDTIALDVPDTSLGFDLDMMAIVIELGSESMAVPVLELRQVDVVNLDVDDAPVAVVLPPGSDRWQVFSRQLDDEVIELELVDDMLREVGGNRRFDPALGLAANGDADLARLPGFTSFPSDYATFFPDGAFWTVDGVMPVG